MAELPEWQRSRVGEAYTLVLGPVLRLEVIRAIGTRGGPPPPYHVVIFGARMKAEFSTPDEAKTYAVRVGKKWLAHAALALSGGADA